MNLKLCLEYFLFVLLANLTLGRCITVEEELTLTRQEKNALDKFKPMVEKDKLVTQSYMKQDIYLIKWLRIGNLDLTSTKDLFKAHLKWRRDNKIDKVLDEDFSTVKESFPIFLDGEDKTGRPIIAADAGSWDVRRGVISGLRDAVLRYIYYAIELQSKKIRKKQQLGQNVTQMQVVLDLSGYNLVQHGCLNCISVYAEFVRSFVHRYPYMADSVILVNIPPIFEVVVEALDLRSAGTVSIKIFGPRKSEWKKYLLSIASEDQLPKFLGGTLELDAL